MFDETNFFESHEKEMKRYFEIERLRRLGSFLDSFEMVVGVYGRVITKLTNDAEQLAKDVESANQFISDQ
jgi:hypothetical protein